MLDAKTKNAWKEYWSALQVDEGVEQGNIKLFGLRHTMPPAIDYLTMERALKAGGKKAFHVEEVSVSGDVTELNLHNGLDSPVLLVEGEILLGAKQTRTVYTTILVDKKSDIKIPVACVEQGRWSHRPGARFGLSNEYAHSSLRAAKLAFMGKYREERASTPLAREEAYPVDQAGVWDKVRDFMLGSQSHSPTDSADESYRAFKKQSGRSIEFACPPDCCGIAVAIDGQITGIECFDRPDTMEKIFPRLIQSYISEAMMRRLQSEGKAKVAEQESGGGKTLASEAIRTFLRDVADTEVTSAPGVGMGEDLRAQSKEWSAAVLAYEGSGLHGQVLSS